MTGPEHARLPLDPDLPRQDAVDGAWWPASYAAGAEPPALIAAVDQRLERRVLRVGLHVDTWPNVPRRIAAPRRQVKVGWFGTIDPHVVPGLDGDPGAVRRRAGSGCPRGRSAGHSRPGRAGISQQDT
ncbi:DUF5994 family protein [Nonomuraea spiralis]|uniref:DUF5994 family protein n=1 Tax=Nonomuraea spiralis TaxID=46182 RepID=UPI0037A0A58C